jgi:hypothetical protein
LSSDFSLGIVMSAAVSLAVNTSAGLRCLRTPSPLTKNQLLNILTERELVMATVDFKPNPDCSLEQDLRHLQLYSLMARLCPPRDSPPDPEVCRLIVDSRLPWWFEMIDGRTSWMYLPTPARTRLEMGCQVVTLD